MSNYTGCRFRKRERKKKRVTRLSRIIAIYLGDKTTIIYN